MTTKNKTNKARGYAKSLREPGLTGLVSKLVESENGSAATALLQETALAVLGERITDIAETIEDAVGQVGGVISDALSGIELDDDEYQLVTHEILQRSTESILADVLHALAKKKKAA